MVNFLISSSVFILIVILLRCFCHKHISMRIQYMLWLLVAIKLLVFPVPWIESKISIFNIPDKLQSITVQRTTASAAENNVFIQEVQNEAGQTDNIAGAKDRISDIKSHELSNINLQVILHVFAVIGSCIFFIFWIGSNLRFWNYLRKHRINVTRYNIELPFSMNLQVYVVLQLPTPCLYGKAIYITPDCTMDETRLRHILAHEYSHYKQGDLLWSLIRGICLSLYWWHPLVWAAAHLSKQDCELSCDEAALKLLDEKERLDYGKTLLSLITVKATPKDYFSAATTMTKGKKNLKQRISFIAQKPRVIIPICILAISTVVFGLVCTSTAKRNDKTDISLASSIPEENTILPTSGTYTMEGTENETAPTRLSLDTEAQTLIFAVDPLSSYLPFCKYEISENYIKSKTTDGLYYYTLKILDAETLMFIRDESCEPIVIDSRFFTAPYDGAIFKLTAETSETSNPYLSTLTNIEVYTGNADVLLDDLLTD